MLVKVMTEIAILSPRTNHSIYSRRPKLRATGNAIKSKNVIVFKAGPDRDLSADPLSGGIIQFHRETKGGKQGIPFSQYRLPLDSHMMLEEL